MFYMSGPLNFRIERASLKKPRFFERVKGVEPSYRLWQRRTLTVVLHPQIFVPEVGIEPTTLAFSEQCYYQ